MQDDNTAVPALPASDSTHNTHMYTEAKVTQAQDALGQMSLQVNHLFHVLSFFI
jgi:hypothetical protein